jgi:hypothetical protein
MEGNRRRGRASEKNSNANAFDTEYSAFSSAVISGGVYTPEGVRSGLTRVADAASSGLTPGDNGGLSQRFNRLSELAGQAADFAVSSGDDATAQALRASAEGYTNIASVLTPGVEEPVPSVPQASQMSSSKK